MDEDIRQELSIVTSAEWRGDKSMSQYCNMITKTSSLDAAGRRKEQISAKKTEINSLEKRTG